MNFIILVIYTILLIGGGGFSDVSRISFFSLLSLGLYESVKDKNYLVLFVNFTLLVIVIVRPSFIHLLGFVALMAYVNKNHRQSLLAITIIWVAQIIGYKACPVFATILLMVCSAFVYYKTKNHTSTIITVLCSFIVIGDTVSYFMKKDYCVENILVANEQYKPGQIFSTITGCPILDSSQCKGRNVIRTYAVGSKMRYEESGICIMEHSPAVTNNIVIGGKWQQPVSWNDNVFCGDQYMVEAISNDGGLWSNIGTNLKDTCQVILAYRNCINGYQPLIVKDGNTIYLHDSDYTSGRLSNYQKSLIQEIASPVCMGRPLLVRLINIFLLLLIIVLSNPLLQKKQSLLVSILGVLIFFTSFSSYIIKNKGDIRLVGEIKDSHENNRFDGVVKTLVDNGYYYIVGEDECKILVVKEEHSATYRCESIIVLEPNASIKIQGNKFVAGEIPMPPVEFDTMMLKDPRNLTINGKQIGPIYKSGNITIIGTGSPALLEWRKLLK